MTVYGIAYVDAEGHIDSFYIPGPTGYPEEGTSEADNTKTIVHVTDEVTDMSSFVKYKYYKDGIWKSRTGPPADYYNWKDEAWVLDSTELYLQLRKERDLRLYQCDWTQLDDSKLSMTKKGEWAEYRQALREVPQTNGDAKLLSEVVWPDKPSQKNNS